MPRHILSEDRIHPAIRTQVSSSYENIVTEVSTAVAENAVVVVGMSQNPHPMKARRLLKKHNIPHAYLEYGSYLSEWRRRNALKMWSGWPTFPMIFVHGTLIGGASDLIALQSSGELTTLLSAGRARHNAGEA